MAVIIIGTVGFMIIEHLSFLDALYFTVVTISTVGYGDVSPASTGGKIFAIIVIIIGIGAFLTLLTSLAQWLIQRRQLALHRHRLNMLIGVFYTEVGNRLLHTFSRFDPDISKLRQDFMVTPEWSATEFQHLKNRLNAYKHNIDAALLDFEEIRRYLHEKGDMLVHQLENPDLVENEIYAELLWAVVHLRDELVARHSLKKLPESDIAHLVIDVKRAYRLLTQQWIDYMQYLKSRYPFLFSLALRTNPFVESPSAIVH
ncbi:MAG: two pore domain potassium channel family protein [Dehalococcoidales bacterium]|nr:two pore domain potassium channel family protein [Dehalococcoidales bacterium]